MGKTRVLQMPIGNARGGITQYAIKNLQFINRDKFAVDFATRSPSLDFSHLLEKLGSKVYHFSCSSLENEDRFIQEINAILDRGYDVVHLHTSYWKGLCAEKTAMERNCPLVIVHAHSTMVDLDDAEERTSAIALHENIKQAFLPSMANRFCACSIAAADWLFGNSIPRDKVRILKNAVDVDEFAFSPATRERVREELNLSDKLVLGHVGRFAFQKNHEMILDIFARIHEIDARAVLLLVGDGPLLEKTKRSAVERDLAGHIRFLGRRWDVANLMQAMDIYIHPSRFEGFGLVLLEAQTTGLRCLASASLPPEVRVTPNLSFIAGGEDAWVKSIMELAEGYERHDGSRLVVGAGYSLKNQIAEIEKLYSDL